MNRLIIILFLLVSASVNAADVTVLTYHDIVSDSSGDEYAVTMDNFRRQLDYIKDNGYRPISLAQYQEAVRKRKTLPGKSVMLTFDDGLLSYRDKILPVLREYGYPSVLSIVSSWVDGKKEPRQYRGKLLRWGDLRELKKEPLVEIVSHSHALHRYVAGSPLGTRSPSATTRVYQDSVGRYENEQSFRKRIQQDLDAARKRFASELGANPAALTWPYGEYDPVTLQIATSAGFRFQLTLDEGGASREELPVVRRYMVLRDHGIAQFREIFRPRNKKTRERRFVEFDLDIFGHVSRPNHLLLIKQLVRRIGSLGVDTIVVTPFSADGNKAYFANEYIPVEHDLLNAVIDRARTRLKIKHVYLRFPDGMELLPDSLFSELARTSRFSALLFDRPPTAERRNRIQRALDQYRSSVQIGSWRAGNTGLDIAVVDRVPPASRTSDGKTVLVRLDRNDYLTNGGLADALVSVRKQGISSYGYGSLNYMAGARAPADLVSAMAYTDAGKIDD